MTIAAVLHPTVRDAAFVFDGRAAVSGPRISSHAAVSAIPPHRTPA